MPDPQTIPVRSGPLVWLSHGCGLGLLPKAPGTWGSLAGPVLAWGLQTLHPIWGCPLATIPLFLAGVSICNAGQRYFGVKDPQQVVFDEIAAFTCVFALTPVNLWTAVVGFVLFRLFDITKPWPIRLFEQLPRGWGIMADDTAAGLVAGAILTALYYGLGAVSAASL